MKAIGIIPARYASSRFPGKPLVDIGGQSLVERTWRQASKAVQLSEVVVATDDERIFEHVTAFGGKAVMTRQEHPSGTDRCAEAAALFPDFDIVVNIQGDEPFIAPEQIDAVLHPLLMHSEIAVATLAKAIEHRDEIFNPNVVKVVMDKHGRAMYFSRSPIPYLRNIPQEEWPGIHFFYKHIGLYAFRREALLELTALPPGVYEQAESLEQLRWLSAGYFIAVTLTDRETMGIDTPEDVERARERMEPDAK